MIPTGIRPRQCSHCRTGCSVWVSSRLTRCALVRPSVRERALAACLFLPEPDSIAYGVDVVGCHIKPRWCGEVLSGTCRSSPQNVKPVRWPDSIPARLSAEAWPLTIDYSFALALSLSLGHRGRDVSFHVAGGPRCYCPNHRGCVVRHFAFPALGMWIASSISAASVPASHSVSSSA